VRHPHHAANRLIIAAILADWLRQTSLDCGPTWTTIDGKTALQSTPRYPGASAAHRRWRRTGTTVLSGLADYYRFPKAPTPHSTSMCGAKTTPQLRVAMPAEFIEATLGEACSTNDPLGARG